MSSAELQLSESSTRGISMRALTLSRKILLKFMKKNLWRTNPSKNTRVLDKRVLSK